MRKISLKIILAFFIILILSTIIPRIIGYFFGELPVGEYVQSDYFLFGMLIMVTTSLLLFILVIQKMIITRVKRLNDATKVVAKGHYDITLENNGKDEISSLINHFNQMVHELQANEYLSKDFIRNFTHEFKTPISAINGYAALMATEQLTQDEIQAYAQIIYTESKRLSLLSHSILQLSMIDSTNVKTESNPYNVTEQVRSIIQMLQLNWEQKQLSFDLQVDEINITLNQEWTYQIWKNLIENAIQYARDDTTIAITLSTVDDNLQCSISNQGKGITQIEQQNIFKLFYRGTSKQNTSGSGIGLSIVEKAVNKLSGNIEVTSDGQTYTTFTVTLPLT